MRDLNEVRLIGYAGRDPEIRYTGDGMAVANLSVATTYNKGKDNESTEWHRLVAFDKTAELIGDHVEKGARLLVTGSLQTRSWADDSGTKRYVTEIRVQDFEVMRPARGADPVPQGAGSGAAAGTQAQSGDMPF